MIAALLREGTLEGKHRDHALVGQYVGCRECRLAPDRLLIYGVQKPGQLDLIRFGTHADLFGL